MSRTKKEPETGLVLANDLIGAELGKAIIERAQTANREALQGAVVAAVQGFQVQLKKQRDYLASCQANIALLEAKLRAVEAGDVRVSTYGAMSYVDPALDKGVVRMAECLNCGAPTTGW